MRLSGLTSSCLMADSRSRMASRSTSCSICRKSAVLEDLQHRQGGHTEVNTDRWSYRGQHRQVVIQRSKQTGGHTEVQTDRWSYRGQHRQMVIQRSTQTGGHTEVNTDRWSYRGQHRQVVIQRSKQTGGHAEVNTDRWSYMGYNTDRIPYKGGIMLVTVALHYRWEHKIFLK